MLTTIRSCVDTWRFLSRLAAPARFARLGCSAAPSLSGIIRAASTTLPVRTRTAVWDGPTARRRGLGPRHGRCLGLDCHFGMPAQQPSLCLAPSTNPPGKVSTRPSSTSSSHRGPYRRCESCPLGQITGMRPKNELHMLRGDPLATKTPADASVSRSSIAEAGHSRWLRSNESIWASSLSEPSERTEIGVFAATVDLSFRRALTYHSIGTRQFLCPRSIWSIVEAGSPRGAHARRCAPR
jgi:hypothetical protein